MEKEILVKARHASKIYNAKQKNEVIALNDITFDMAQGDFIAVMGNSGSGKTTFMNNMSLIDLPTEGRVFICDKAAALLVYYGGKKLREINIGYIFQECNLIEELSVYDNISLPYLLRFPKNKDVDEKVKWIADKVGISSLLSKTPDQCSGGQRQRIAVARALVTSPRYIVADEATGNLDSKNGNEIMKILSKFNQEMNSTILLVTHDPIMASYAKTVLYIQDGNIKHRIEKENCSQMDFYKKLIDIDSKESLALI